MKTKSKIGVAVMTLAVLFSAFAFRTNELCSISGTVKEKGTEIKVSSATVALTQNGKQIQSAITDPNGKFCFLKLADGSYDITISCPGYASQMLTKIIVNEGTSSEVKIELSRSAPKVDDVVITGSKLQQLKSVECVSMEVMKAKATGGKKNNNAVYCPTIGYAGQAGLLRAAESRSYRTQFSSNHYRASDLATAPPAIAADLDVEPKPKETVVIEENNSEDYDGIVENEFLKPTEKALSTFSIDVDVASYGIMRKKIEQNQKPPKESIRLEELINYFTYDYADPKDDKPFSVSTEASECPWNPKHQLLEIGIQGKRMEKSNLPPSNLVFLIDVSGSMQMPDKLPLVKQSLRMLVKELSEKDRIAMTVYAGSAGLVLPSTSCSEKDKIIEAIDRLEAGGSTAGAAGINLAYKVAKENFLDIGNNRVILCTDGDFNVGVSGDAELTSLIEEKREQGIFLSVLGFGMGNYKDSKMEKLADKGNGNYAYIDNLMEARKNLVTQMGGTLLTIAKDVKIQVEFNPAKVKAYRLIGYENRALADADFNNDKKDAGEIGAGTSVTALYEIISDENDPSYKEMSKTDPLKYQTTDVKSLAQNRDELIYLKIRYKEPRENISKLLEIQVKDQVKKIAETSDNFRFAASVASFGMLLRDSKFKGNFSLDKVKELASNAKGKDAEGYRSEFVKLVGKTSQLQITGNR